VTEAEKERAAVVAWLFDNAAEGRAALSRQVVSPARARDYKWQISTLTGVARAIENGDHLTEKGKDQ